MAKSQRGIFNAKGIPLEELFNLGFRIFSALIGLALLFVAAIYYGIINP